MEIMKNAVRGNRKALVALYEKNKKKVYYLAKQLLQDESRAIEVSARVFKEQLTRLPETEEAFSQKLTEQVALYCRKKMGKELQLPPNNNFTINGNFEGFAHIAEQALTLFSPLQRFIYVLETLCGYDAVMIARVLNLDQRTVQMALEAQRRNLFRILQTDDPAIIRAMATKYVDGALAAEVPEKLEGQVQLVIHSIAAPAEKKNKQILLTAVISGVVCIALIVGIVLGGKAIQNHSYTDTTSGEGGTSTVTPDGLKTTSTLDAEKTYYADITVRDYGKITVKLDQKNAPVSASNFVELAEDGFYDGLTFHRIMEGFMMQGGDPQGDGYGGSKQNILGEFASNGVNNPLSHTRGAISMARSGQPNSGSSQFFIVHEDSTFLDGDYAVFGYVTEGIEVVDAVCKAAEPTDGNGTIPAAKQPIMESVVIRTE